MKLDLLFGMSRRFFVQPQQDPPSSVGRRHPFHRWEEALPDRHPDEDCGICLVHRSRRRRRRSHPSEGPPGPAPRQGPGASPLLGDEAKASVDKVSFFPWKLLLDVIFTYGEAVRS